MAALPTSTVANGLRVFTVSGSSAGLVGISRTSDGASIQAFVPGAWGVTTPVAQVPQSGLFIASVTPAQAPAGASVVIKGAGLVDLTAVYFGTAYITVAPSYSDPTTVVVTVPNGANGAVRVDTAAGSTNTLPFTVGPTALTPLTFGTWSNLTFSASRASDLVQTGQVFSTTATGGSWGHGGLDSQSLGFNVDGGVRLRYLNTGGAAGAVGLHDANTRVPQPQMRYSMYIEPNDTISIFYVSPGSSAEAASTGIPATAGNYYLLARRFGVVFVAESTDGTTWTIIYTHTPARTSFLPLYVLCDINANPAFHLQNPQFALFA